MNSLQRVLAVLQGQPVDRPAFTLLLSLYGARLTGAPLREHYADPEVYAEGQLAVREAFGPDLLFAPFALTLLAEAFGGTLRHHESQPPTLAQPGFGNASEALAALTIEPDGHPSLRYLLDSVNILAKRLNGETVLVGVTLSPVDLPVMLLGVENWMGSLLFDAAAAQALLERSAAFCEAFGNRMLSAGATVLAFTANFANPGMMPRQTIETTLLPVLSAWASRIQGPLVLHHGGFQLAPHLDLLKGLPHVTGYVLDARDHQAEGRRRLGETPLLLGGLDGPSLDRFPPETLDQHCREILRARQADPRFILASGSADIPLATPLETLRAVGSAVAMMAEAPQ